MSKVFRMKFEKYGDMIYISHLDVQRLLHRAFRRAEIEVSYSQGFNPHPKMSYGNALALGVESFGEYVDVEVEDDLSSDELLKRINTQMPEEMQFLKCVELDDTKKSLAANIEYGKYEFVIDIDRAKEGADKDAVIEQKSFSEQNVKRAIDEIMSADEIIITKKNKKGKIVESNIRPMIKSLDVIEADGKCIKIEGVLSTGSKLNLNTNVFLPIFIKKLGIDMDPLDIDIVRYDLYFVEGENLVTPI